MGHELVKKVHISKNKGMDWMSLLGEPLNWE
jgi:hypothetical protein